MIRVGISGFGRIGRLVFRSAWEREDVEIVAVNDPFMKPDYMAYLLQYDSVHGKFPFDVKVKGYSLIVEGKEVRIFQEMDPGDIRWDVVKAGVVCECSGHFRTLAKASLHLEHGPRKVVISSPSPDAPIFLVGINEDQYKGEQVVSNGSCTTNCVAILSRILDDNFGIQEAFMTTVHSTTTGQVTVDGPSATKTDYRAGRTASTNIVPATTGATTCLRRLLPDLGSKIAGLAFRVPTTNVSVLDLTCMLEKPASLDAIGQVVKEASERKYKGVVSYVDEPVVSQDFVHDRHSCVFDKNASMSLGDKFFKLIAWYDNEWSYSNRLLDLACSIGK